MQPLLSTVCIHWDGSTAAACCLQLIHSGERDRLKQLLRDKLTECGWRDEVKQRCRGVLVACAVSQSWPRSQALQAPTLQIAHGRDCVYYRPCNSVIRVSHLSQTC
jgi:hypothetical protein